MPSASAILLRRVGEVSGRAEADDAMFESRADADPFVADDAVPDGIRAMLERLRPGGEGASQWLLRVPYAESDEPMAAQAGGEL